MARLSTLGHGACSVGLPQGEMPKLAEKVAGGRRQDRIPWEGQERKGTFIGGLGKVAIIFPKEEAMDGGQFEALFTKLQLRSEL